MLFRSKYNFLKELVYLKFLASGEGLTMDPKKVKAILKWPIPRSATKVRYFHGLASFYKKIIRGFSKIYGPLTEIMGGIENNLGGL